MKLSKYSKNTVKKGLKTALFSIFLLSILSCQTTITYSRKNIEQVIETICQNEFDIAAKAWLTGHTLWVYVPFGKMLNEAGGLSADFNQKNRQIFLTLRRAFLNMDDPPRFYCFVLSDTEAQGIDLYRLGFVPDLIKLQMNLISLKQFEQRMVLLPLENKKALGDKEGKHVARYDISMGDFIGYLIRQKLSKAFALYPNQVNFKESRSYYQKGKLRITFDIDIKAKDEKIPEPFQKTKEITKEYLKIYGRPDEIIEIEIIDSLGRKSTFTQAALFNAR